MSGLVAKGTTLEWCATENGSYAEIASVFDIKSPKKTRKTTERTTLANEVQRKGAAHIELGQLTAQLRYDAADVDDINDLIDDGATLWWKITASDGTGWKGQGIPKEIGDSYPLGDEILVDFMIEATDAWDRIAGS